MINGHNGAVHFGGNMQTKFLLIFLMVFLLILGCGRNSDFKGAILEVKESSIIVGEEDTDPEAQYQSYEIIIDDKTKFSGEVESFKDLEKWVSRTEHPIVYLWLMNEGENTKIDKRVASEVIVKKK
ncbi:hypothetical protein [Rossellomorea aquimaris]|uniref:DUF3221 domain-containing protein n=1 Tax=Rossellomorea aquimaris TaxID=189382 RepID=A0A366EDM0_9BACI|nr:hypothetical protein [Rossellomorea aquimaris]RBO99594.1 hypothetical protein DET59_13210 [Rossellomorea aquimaris]